MVTSLQGGYKEVEQGTEHIITTRETFNEISKAVIDMVDRIKVVSENLADIAGSSQEMNGSIQEIAAISEEFAAGVEETSASSQQSSSAMQEVTASSYDLLDCRRTKWISTQIYALNFSIKNTCHFL